MGAGSGRGNRRLATLVFAMVVLSLGPVFTIGGVVLAVPSVSSVTVERENLTTAELSVEIADPGTGENTVELRYRVKSEDPNSPNPWLGPNGSDVAGSTADFNLTELTQGTTYEAQASVNQGSWSSPDTEFATLPTDFYIEDVKGYFWYTSFSATLFVLDGTSPLAERNSNGEFRKNLYVRYYAEPMSYPVKWTSIPVISSTKQKPSFKLTGLTPDTGYHVEVSLDSDFNYSSGWRHTITIGFNTPAKDHVSSVEATNVTKTSATIVVNVDDYLCICNHTVYWRYRVKGTTNWLISDDITTVRKIGTFDLTDLTPDTDYEVQGSLDLSFSTSAWATFTTKNPGLERVDVVDVTQTGATVNVTVNDPNGEYQDVYVHYCQSEERQGTPQCVGQWSDRQDDSITTDVNSQVKTASFTLSNLLPDTTYLVEASLEDEFPTNDPQDADGTVLTRRSEQFETDPPRVTGVSVSEKTQTQAKVIATIDHTTRRDQVVNYRLRTFTELGGNKQYTNWGNIQQTEPTQTTTAEKTLENLLAGTNYRIEMWLDSDVADGDRKFDEFKTHDPTVSGVTVTDVEQTTATATVDIVPHGGSARTVYVQYQAAGETVWSPLTPVEKSTADNSVEVGLDGLWAGRDYVVRASLNDQFLPGETVESEEFKTHDPTVSGVTVTDVEQTTATATVDIVPHGGSARTVYVQYQAAGETVWSPLTPVEKSTADNSVEVGLDGLWAGRDYVVRASLNDQFLAGGTVESEEFTTEGPTVSGVTVTDVEQTTATATVAIDEPTGLNQTVYLRYGTPGPVVDKDADWTKTTVDTDASNEDSGTSVNKELDDLTSDTTYVVEASLGAQFPDGETQASQPFTTKPPKILKVRVVPTSETAATATVTITAPSGNVQTVNLRYRTAQQGATPPGAWSSPVETADPTGESATIALRGLTGGTLYDVEAWLVRDASHVVTTNFTTLPGIRGITMRDIEQITATAIVTFDNPDAVNKVIYLRYQAGDTTWIKRTGTTDETSQRFDLSGLISGTLYNVQASIDDFTTYQPATFTTVPPLVGGAEVVAGSVSQTGAVVRVTILHHNGEDRTVRLRYGKASDVANKASWPVLFLDADGASVDFDLGPTVSGGLVSGGLVSGTEYLVEAFTDRVGDEQEPRDTTDPPIAFTTVPPLVGGAEVVAGSVSQTGAVVRVTILHHNGEDRTVRLRYGKASDVANKASWPVLFLDADGASVDFDLGPTVSGGLVSGGLVSGTEYLVEAFTDRVGDEQEPRDTTDPPIAFTTVPPLVGGAEVVAGSVSQTGAVVRVTILHHNGEDRTVRLRYGKASDVANKASWPVLFLDADGASVDFDLAPTVSGGLVSGGLVSGTEYLVEAFTDRVGDEQEPRDTTDPPIAFTTEPPSISGVSILNKRLDRATVRVTIQAPNGEPAYLQYRRSDRPGTPDGVIDPEWPSKEDTLEAEPTDGTADFHLSDLEKHRRYESRVSMEEGFPREATRRYYFTTALISLILKDVTQNTAVIKTEISHRDPSAQMVYMRYGMISSPGSSPDAWLGNEQAELPAPSPQEGAKSTSRQEGSGTTKEEEVGEDETLEMVSHEFTLDDLTEDTPYQVQVALDSFEGEPFPAYEFLEFKTLPKSDNTGNPGGGGSGGGGSGGGGSGGGGSGGGGRPPLQVEYTDVPDGHTHKEAIDALAAEGIFVGTECRPGEFCPEKPIPRWVMAVWLVRLIDGKEPEPVTESSFVDVNPGKWWAAHVERLWDLRITIGCWDEPGDFRYCPEASTTRAQMASFLVRMYKFAPAVSAGFVDTAHTSHRFDIDSLYAVGVTKGCFVNPLRYCPDEPTSRGEMATFLYRTRLHLGTTS